MSVDFRVEMAPGSPHCVPAVALALLEGMSNRECQDDPAEVYARLEAEGLTVPGGVPMDNIVASMALVGAWGANCEGATVYGDSPYRVNAKQMMDALRAGIRPWMFVYQRSDGGSHAVTAIAADGGTVTLVDPAGGPNVPAPTDQVLKWGQAAFAYGGHREVTAPEPPGEYLPIGVEVDHFGPWREACKVAQTDYTATQAFLDHLQAIGADWTDPHRYGYPRHAPIEAPPPPAKKMLAVQVWQNFDPAKVAAMAVDAGLNTVVVKALDGTFWMGNGFGGNPNGPESAAAQRDYFHSLGLAYGLWTNPLFGDDAFLLEQAKQTALAAQNCDMLFLDTEPYSEFWGANRPPGKAELFMREVRRLAPDAVIYWQPDPRPMRLQELRPEEWAPFMDGWAGQHYFDQFSTTPEHEVGAAVNQHARWTPEGVLIPTFSINGVSALEMERAGRASAAVSADGFCLWRYGLGMDGALAKATIKGWDG